MRIQQSGSYLSSSVIMIFILVLCCCCCALLSQAASTFPAPQAAQPVAVPGSSPGSLPELSPGGPSKLNANNVLEALSSMGKAIQQQVAAASSQFQIAPASNEFLGTGNTRKNEYQPVQEQPQFTSAAAAASNSSAPNYREQGEVLRQEILRRAGHLQQVVGSSLEMLRNNSDLIVRRLLEQLNQRLDQAKSKADRIINEPATNELAVKTLNTINLGLNNLNTMISNIVTRLEASAREQQQQQQQVNGSANNLSLMSAGGPQQRNSAAQVAAFANQLDPVKLRLSLAQLREHFSTAINAAHQQQKQLQLKLAQTSPTHLAQQQQQATNLHRQSA